MTERPRQNTGGLHRHETAGLGARGPRIAGVGSEHGRLVRLVLLSYTRWPSRPQHAPWPSNKTLATRAGLTERQVERALAVLRDAGELTNRWGHRQGARRSMGRLLELGLHAPCKALAPEAVDVGWLWMIGRSRRTRPAALVTAMVGAYMLASDAAGEEHIEDWAELGCSMAAWRRFVGHKDNHSWTRRVRELEELGLIRREGRKITVSPPRAWFSLAVATRTKRHLVPAAANDGNSERPTPRPTPRPAAVRPRPVVAGAGDWPVGPSPWVEVGQHDVVAPCASLADGIVVGWLGSPPTTRDLPPPARLLRVSEFELELQRTGTESRGPP